MSGSGSSKAAKRHLADGATPLPFTEAALNIEAGLKPRPDVAQMLLEHGISGMTFGQRRDHRGRLGCLRVDV